MRWAGYVARKERREVETGFRRGNMTETDHLETLAQVEK